MSEYAWKIAAQQWRNDPYYVASSAPVHKVTVVADSKKAALAEAERLLDEPSAGRYWRFWVGKATDVRLGEGDVVSAQQEAKDAALRDALRSRYVRGVAVEATVGVWEAAFDAAWKARGEADRAALEDLLADEGEIDYEETNRAAGVAAAIAALDEQ